MKQHKHILLFLLAITIVQAKYAHNVDVTDWSSKNIGRIKDAIIDRSNIYFVGTNGLFGHMSKQTGQIQVSHGITQDRIVSWKNYEEDYNERVIVQDNIGLFSYNVVKSKFDKINIESQIGKMIDHSIIDAESLFVLTQQQLVLASKNSIQVILKAGSNQVYKNIVKIQQSGYALVSLNDENKQVCVQIFSKEKLVNKEVSNATGENSKCWEKSSEVLSEEELNKVLISSQYIAYKTKAFSYQTQQFIDLPEKKENDLFHLDYKTGVYVVIRDYKATFYTFEKGSFNEIYQFDKKGLFQYAFDHQVSNKKHFNFMVYSNGMSSLFQINLENTQTKKEATMLSQFKPKYSETQPIKFWLKSKDSLELLIQDYDLRTYFFIPANAVPKTAGSGELWSREDGLALLDGLIMVDYRQAQNKKINPYYQSLEKNGINNPIYILPNLKERITNEIKSIYNYLKSNSSQITHFFNSLINVRSLKDLYALNKLITSDAEYDITYGLKKVLVCVNKQRTIYSIDSKTGDVLWKSSFIARYVTPDYDFHGFYQIENRDGATVTEETLLIYHSPKTTKLFIFTVQPLTGDLGYVAKHLMQKVRKVFKIHLETLTVQQAMVIIDQDMSVYGYPNSLANPLNEEKHDNIFYFFEKENKTINGYRYQNQNFTKIWNYKLANNEELIDIQSSSFEQNHPKIAIFDDFKVILKHIDYSNIAILTKKVTTETLSGNGILSLKIFNCKSGRQIYGAYEPNVHLSYPINLVYDENGIFVSYYNPVHTIYQIWTIELFSNKMETSFVTMLQNYYFSQAQYEEFNYINENLDVIALEQKYGYSLGIKKMGVVTTKLSLTKRNLMIITPTNQIHSLDRDIISTRRAIKGLPKDAQIQTGLTFESTTLPPYSYLIPIDKFSVITYHSNLNDIKELSFSGSNLESTIIFIAYGNDIFMSSIAPDRTYDMINEDFNYIIVTFSIIVSIIGVFIAKKYAVKSVLHKLFENKEVVSAM